MNVLTLWTGMTGALNQPKLLNKLWTFLCESNWNSLVNQLGKISLNPCYFCLSLMVHILIYKSVKSRNKVCHNCLISCTNLLLITFLHSRFTAAKRMKCLNSSGFKVSSNVQLFFSISCPKGIWVCHMFTHISGCGVTIMY